MFSNLEKIGRLSNQTNRLGKHPEANFLFAVTEWRYPHTPNPYFSPFQMKIGLIVNSGDFCMNAKTKCHFLGFWHPPLKNWVRSTMEKSFTARDSQFTMH